MLDRGCREVTTMRTMTAGVRCAGWLTMAALAGCAGTPATGGGAASAGRITLTAAEARIIGSDAKLERTATEEHVGWWERTNTYLQWTARGITPGTYAVEAVYSLDPRFVGSTIAASVGTQMVATKLGATKNWDDYHPVHVGDIRIDHAGDATVTLKALEKPTLFVMNLQRLVLTRKE
jgi:hypothetical protein